MEKYFIFSDECGSWANHECKFYLRAWIKIDEARYLYLKGLWSKDKLPSPSEKSLRKNSKKIADILNKENFNFIFTFTKLNEFYLRKWVIRDTVSLALSQLENILQKEYEKKIPKKLKVALNQVLFLNVYERFHIENAIEYLGMKNGFIYEFLINKPQFSKNDYLEIFENIKNKYSINSQISFFKNNENELGVKFADAICTMFGKALNNDDTQCISFLKNNIFSKSVAGGIGIKGINKIFYPINKSYGREDLQMEEKEIINKLRKNFS